ncbi:MAG: dihydrofolate reductase [Firmicutes bacterium]|nr:dihydrofolate reductase [Bacillota bacterium]
MRLNIIAAIGKNNELGKNNDLIWHLPNDLKFFKKMTTGKTILMGKNTFDSLPGLLPNRKHIVFNFSKDFKNDEIEIFNSIDDFIKKYKTSDEDIFVIGGASIYKQFIDKVNIMYLTEINAEDKKADVFFPCFNKDEWNKNVIGSNTDNNIEYKHVKYIRK